MLRQNKFTKTYYRQNPATSCLKEAQIAQLKEKATDKEEKVHYMYEAPDPVFIKDTEFDRYLNLREGEAVIEKYDKADVEVYENFDNADFDDIANEIGRNAGLAGLVAHPERMNGFLPSY